MKICMASVSTLRNNLSVLSKCPYFLESFYYIQEWLIPYAKKAELFLLDSGAFTFMSSKTNKDNVDFEQYLDEYISFINKHDVKYFFELDIDSVVGYEEVKRLRRKLEAKTGKKCIPVWHKSRGLEEWKKMCEEYDYVAIGGIVTKEIKQKEYLILNKLIDIAHKEGCLVHGLGFTHTQYIKIVNFDSVDSTTWTYGQRYALGYYFQKNTIKMKARKQNQKLKKERVYDLSLNNFNEWIKYQYYMDKVWVRKENK